MNGRTRNYFCSMSEEVLGLSGSTVLPPSLLKFISKAHSSIFSSIVFNLLVAAVKICCNVCNFSVAGLVFCKTCYTKVIFNYFLLFICLVH
jgi:hypothetical protein